MKYRRAEVICDGLAAGILEEVTEGYRFTYLPQYLNQKFRSSPVSLTLPLRAESYESPSLFAFFYGLIPEGSMREILCRRQRIDENDYFGILLLSTQEDTIGNILIRPLSDPNPDKSEMGEKDTNNHSKESSS
jgi:serine/threonine-protein kinase HipA